MESFYIYPEAARKKLKAAWDMKQMAYIYGATGYGKTELVNHYFARRTHCYLDAATDTLEQFQIPHTGCNIVVIDNLQAAEPEEIREEIVKLVARRDIWLVLLARCNCPSWLASACVRQYPFVTIEENDLKLSVLETGKYLEAHNLFLDDEEIRKITEDCQGNPLVLKILVSQMLNKGRDPKRKVYVYDGEVFAKTQKIFWDYIDREIYDQWEPELLEFVQQLCIVDSFDVPLAEAITGRNNVESLLHRALDTGNFLVEKQGEYHFVTTVIKSMRKRIKTRYAKEEQGRLYYNAGQYFKQKGQTLKALKMFEICGDEKQISNILIENARMNPGNGYLYELRNYYLTIPENYILDSVELMAGMSMLQSLLLNPGESEKWYAHLKEKEKQATGRTRVVIKSWLAYLDIGLPHRGSKNMLSLFKSVSTLVTNREIVLPEFSVTSNMPSMMNGGKDFCEWSKSDKEIELGVGKLASLVLGKYGAGFSELALAESFFEKGEDNYEVVRLLSKGQMKAISYGRLEQEFVVAGLLTKVHLLTGHTEDARLLLTQFLEKAEQKNAEKMIPNIKSLFCRISLYQAEKAEIDEWMQTAPGDLDDFNVLDRFHYLTKVRIYLMYGKYELAEGLLEKLFYYAEIMNRTYIHMECELLLAILQYRRNMPEWMDTLRTVLGKLEEYHFVRLISMEGSVILPLLQKVDGKAKDSEFFKQVLTETTEMAGYYPAYLKEQRPGEEAFSENAIRILRLQAEGMSNEQIAKHLQITEATVKYHCRQTYKKLGVTGKAAAVMEAKKRRII